MILVFGGTTEGRKAVKVLEEAGNAYYSTKTEEQEVAEKLQIPAIRYERIFPKRDASLTWIDENIYRNNARRGRLSCRPHQRSSHHPFDR